MTDFPKGPLMTDLADLAGLARPLRQAADEMKTLPSPGPTPQAGQSSPQVLATLAGIKMAMVAMSGMSDQAASDIDASRAAYEHSDQLSADVFNNLKG